MFDADEISNNQWVLLCEDGKQDDEYKVGFVSQISTKIVKALDNLAEWLEILWESDDENGVAYPVFHILFSTYEERGEVLYDWWLV